MEIDDDHHERLAEEEDGLKRSKRRNKGVAEASDQVQNDGVTGESAKQTNNKISYKETVTGRVYLMGLGESEDLDDGLISDDDVIEESEDASWFGIGMTKEEKIEARRLWRNSLIVKVIGRSVGYHHLWRRIKVMGRTQGDPLMIDLGTIFLLLS